MSRTSGGTGGLPNVVTSITYDGGVVDNAPAINAVIAATGAAFIPQGPNDFGVASPILLGAGQGLEAIAGMDPSTNDPLSCTMVPTAGFSAALTAGQQATYPGLATAPFSNSVPFLVAFCGDESFIHGIDLDAKSGTACTGAAAYIAQNVDIRDSSLTSANAGPTVQKFNITTAITTGVQGSPVTSLGTTALPVAFNPGDWFTVLDYAGTITTTGTFSTSTKFTVASAVGLAVGQYVLDTSTPSNLSPLFAIISAIAGTTITIQSGTVNAGMSGDTLVFGTNIQAFYVTAAAAQSATSVTVESSPFMNLATGNGGSSYVALWLGRNTILFDSGLQATVSGGGNSHGQHTISNITIRGSNTATSLGLDMTTFDLVAEQLRVTNSSKHMTAGGSVVTGGHWTGAGTAYGFNARFVSNSNVANVYFDSGNVADLIQHADFTVNGFNLDLTGCKWVNNSSGNMNAINEMSKNMGVNVSNPSFGSSSGNFNAMIAHNNAHDHIGPFGAPTGLFSTATFAGLFPNAATTPLGSWGPITINGVNIAPRPSPVKFNVGAAPATASTTLVMAGFGSTATFTPAFSGKVKVRFEGTGNTATAAVAFTVAGRYGTGTAPVQGAADTGTAFSQGGAGGMNLRGPAAAAPAAWALNDVISGLTIGTAYWFDCSYDTSAAADTAALSTVYCQIEETF